MTNKPVPAPAEPAEYTCPRCGSNVSTHICMGEPVAGETKRWQLKLDGCDWTERARRTLAMLAEILDTTEYSFEREEDDDAICELSAVAKILAAPSVAVPEGEASDRIFVEVCDLVTYCKKKNKPAGYLAAEVTRLIRNHISATPPTNPVSTGGMTARIGETREAFERCWLIDHPKTWLEVNEDGAYTYRDTRDAFKLWMAGAEAFAHVLAEKGK